MKKIKLIIVLSMFSMITFSQEKPPEVTDDYASILAGDTITVNVLLNDWCMEGHTMKIFYATQGSGGTSSFTDSTITYISSYYFKGIETVTYRVKDMDNFLTSEDGHLIVDISNTGQEELDINNVRALINAHGSQFWNPGNVYGCLYEVPKGSGVSTIFNFNLWMGGYDPENVLHLAGERYRQMGRDFFTGTIANEYMGNHFYKWNNVWKLERSDIEYHQQHFNDLNYEPIENILNWPAHGDISNGEDYYIAPFHDYNNDGEYSPMSGDFPIFRGDQSMYFVYNDETEVHTESDGYKIGVEVHGMPYAFECTGDSIFNNTTFFHYDIINKSDTVYHDYYIGAALDLDLGNAWDDFLGCDTLLEMFYAYNGDPIDENTWIAEYVYGLHPPAQCITFLNVELSKFINYNNSGPNLTDPETAEEYYSYLTGKWKDGSPITIGGNGYGGTIPTNYIYPGNPADTNEWSEVSAGLEPDDIRAVGSVGPYDFYPGDTISLDLAFVFARDYEGDHISSVTLLKERVAQLRWYYENDSTPCGATWSGIENPDMKKQLLSIYPNPASNLLIIQLPGLASVSSYKIYNSVGQLVLEGSIEDPKFQLNIGHLTNGYYIIRINDNDNVMAEKFIKY